MQHPIKNRLIEYYYKEGNKRELKTTREHLQSCFQCQEYLTTLEKTTGILDQLPYVVPEKNICDRVLQNTAVMHKQQAHRKRNFTAISYFQIALSLPFILAILYFIQNRLILLPVWESLEKIRIVHALGSFGFVTVLFFLAGSFITLALAPVLLFDSEKKTYLKKTYKLSWR